MVEVVHPQSGSSSTWILVKLEFGNSGFWGEGKTGVPGEKPLGAKDRTNNKLNPNMVSMLEFEPRPHRLSPLHHPLLLHSVVHVQIYEILLIYLLWFNFVLGLNFIFFCFKLIILHYHTYCQRKIKFKPRTKLDHNI